MELNSVEEIWKGLSNAPIAVCALIVGVLLLLKKGVKWEWRAICLEGAFASFCGMFVHTFKINETYRRIFWVFLYALLFELIRLFSHRVSVYITQKEKHEYITVRIIELVLYVAAAALLVILNRFDMIMLIIFALLCVLRVVMAFVKYPKAPTLLKVLMGVALLAIITLAFENIIPYAVVVCHILIAIAIVIYYFIASKDR